MFDDLIIDKRKESLEEKKKEMEALRKFAKEVFNKPRVVKTKKSLYKQTQDIMKKIKSPEISIWEIH
jgi:hypothetical protein